MEPETHRVNVLLGGGPTAINATKKNCPKCGKDFELRADGNRQCLECGTWGRIKTVKAVDKELAKAQETNEQRRKREYNKAYYQRNRETILSRQNDRDNNRRDEIREYNNDYYKRNRDRMRDVLGEGGAA